MTFNLKKAQKIADSVVPQSVAVHSNAKKYNLSLEDKDIVSINGLLEKDRRSLGSSPVTHEGLLEEVRARSSVSEKITQGALDDSDSVLYPHRQFSEGGDNYSVSPINALSEANDRKFREAFSKANKGADTSFWDKFVGQQLDGEPTKVMVNLPEQGSQLQNKPSRFKNLDGLPSSEDPVVNRDNFGKEIKIQPMVKKEKPIEISSSLQSADKLLFGIYLKANKENRDLNDVEKEIVAAINRDKVDMLMSFAQNEPLNQPSSDGLNPPGADDVNKKDREVDFLDGNPDLTAGDPVLWGNMSGFDTSHSDIEKNDVTETNALDDSGFDFPDPLNPLSGVKSNDVSYTGGIGQTSTTDKSGLDNTIKPQDASIEENIDDAPF